MKPEDLARLADDSRFEATPEIVSRARGAMLASACGDALGVPYEFAAPTDSPEMIGGGLGPYEPGEWSDDTQMAICIAKVAAKGVSLTSEPALDLVGERFLDWLAGGASDVGTQTRAVLAHAAEAGRGDVSDRLHEAADEFSARTDRAAGNGALMRTTPVGLAFPGSRMRTAKAAKAMARLTHYDPLVDQSCILWTEAIRHALTTGRADVRAGLDLLDAQARDYWAKAVDDAEAGAFSASPSCEDSVAPSNAPGTPCSRSATSRASGRCARAWSTPCPWEATRTPSPPSPAACSERPTARRRSPPSGAGRSTAGPA